MECVLTTWVPLNLSAPEIDRFHGEVDDRIHPALAQQGFDLVRTANITFDTNSTPSTPPKLARLPAQVTR